MLNSNRSGFNQLPRALRALSWSPSAHPSVSFFSSGECGNAILQYCYGFNRRQLWLLAQGLLQSVLSLQVSVAILYYSIVMISIYRHQLWLLAQGLLQSVLSLQVSVAMPYYSIVMVSIGVSSGSAS